MNIPNFDDIKPVDKEGNWTPSAKSMFTQLFSAIQNNLSQEGFKISQQPSANIAELNNDKSTSALLYDSDTHELKINLNGEFKTIQTA